MTRLAITGGRGRLAPLIARFFEGNGATVTLFSREANGTFRAMDELVRAATWREFDAVIHCGWSTVPLTAEQSPWSSAQSDLPLLRQLLGAAEESRAHFIFVSSGAVYGDTGPVPADESSPANPIGAYARGKLAAERLVASSPSSSATLRVTNLLGEKANPARPQGILPRLIHAAKSGDEVVLWGDGSATKDYLHCEDFLTALREVLAKRLAGLFNVSSEESVSLLQLVALVEEMSGHRLSIRHEAHYPWDVSFSRISSRKLREAADWRSSLTVRCAVADCLEHFA